MSNPAELVNLKMESDSVNQEVFNDKMKEFHSNNEGSSRSMWDRKQYEKVQSILAKDMKESKSYYNLKKNYELYEVSESECHVIKRRKNGRDKIVYMIPFEDYYDKLLEAHLETGHGGRDRMLYYIKSRWKIARSACEIFLSCCETCNLKKNEVRKGVVVSHVFNARGQVNLIDFQSCPDGEYNWLLNYQDDATKFLHLRPLKSKDAANVADELSKIFFTFGPPSILHSDNASEFLAKVIEKLVEIWPHCKIVHDRIGHSQSQESGEGTNADVENMLRAWMIDRKSTNWSQGCYEVQWLINTSKHPVMKRTPYEAVLGPVHCGLSSLSLPDNILKNVHTEEDLAKRLSELKEPVPEKLLQGGCDVVTKNDECVTYVGESGPIPTRRTIPTPPPCFSEIAQPFDLLVASVERCHVMDNLDQHNCLHFFLRPKFFCDIGFALL